jgi:hypothetical protein
MFGTVPVRESCAGCITNKPRGVFVMSGTHGNSALRAILWGKRERKPRDPSAKCVYLFLYEFKLNYSAENLEKAQLEKYLSKFGQTNFVRLCTSLPFRAKIENPLVQYCFWKLLFNLGYELKYGNDSINSRKFAPWLGKMW